MSVRGACIHKHESLLLPLLLCRTYLLAKAHKLRAAGEQPLEGDVEWNGATTLVYPALCTFAGLCAGVFGVGGGIIKVGRAWCGGGAATNGAGNQPCRKAPGGAALWQCRPCGRALCAAFTDCAAPLCRDLKAALVAPPLFVWALLLQGPLMLEMGILPEVAAATSATMVRSKGPV